MEVLKGADEHGVGAAVPGAVVGDDVQDPLGVDPLLVHQQHLANTGVLPGGSGGGGSSLR